MPVPVPGGGAAPAVANPGLALLATRAVLLVVLIALAAAVLRKGTPGARGRLLLLESGHWRVADGGDQ